MKYGDAKALISVSLPARLTTTNPSQNAFDERMTAISLIHQLIQLVLLIMMSMMALMMK